MDDVNRVETEEDSKLAWERRRFKARQLLKTPAATPLPPGLEHDPIALGLQSRGIPVTRTNWLMADRGSDNLTDLDPETAGMLARMFPEEEN